MKKKWLILIGALLLFSLTFANKNDGMNSTARSSVASFDTTTDTESVTNDTESVTNDTEKVKTNKSNKADK